MLCCFQSCLLRGVALLALLGMCHPRCEAQSFHLFGEQSTTAVAGDESIIHSYDTVANLVANNNSGFSATQINWHSDFSTVGLAFDGKYRLMGEKATGTATAGNESAIFTYDTFSDLVSNNYSSQSFTQINWSGTYSTVGLAYDGAYRLMGEQDTGAGSAGNESFIFTYDTFADLLANNWSSSAATQIDWTANYSTAGLSYDGAFRLMGERNTEHGTAGDESFVYTYDTYTDLLANNESHFEATQINWSAAFATRGLASDIVGGHCDLNYDGAIDAADIAIVFAQWGMAYGRGDVTGDMIVDAADAAICFAEWTGDAAPQSVPEPVGHLVVFMATLSLLASRKSVARSIS